MTNAPPQTPRPPQRRTPRRSARSAASPSGWGWRFFSLELGPGRHGALDLPLHRFRQHGRVREGLPVAELFGLALLPLRDDRDGADRGLGHVPVRPPVDPVRHPLGRQRLTVVGSSAGATSDGPVPRHPRSRFRRALRRGCRTRAVRRGHGALHPHDRYSRQALLRSRRGDRSTPVEAIRTTGASRLQEIVYGVIRRSFRCGSRSRSTVSNPTCAPPPCSA